MAEIGKRNRLAILNESPHGLYLDGGALGPILLPFSLVPRDVTPSAILSVFVYFDSEDRIVATTETPLAMVGEFACLKVLGINRSVGAFLDWGLSKDLLLPFREQKNSPRIGDKIVVRVLVDPQSQRIVASQRLSRHFSKYRPHYAPGEEVDLLVTDETPLGYKAIVNHAHLGLLYSNELAEPLACGQRIVGYVNKVRPDGGIDLRRDKSGYARVRPLSERIMEALAAAGGALELGDKSPPEAVRKAFGASKKAFKQALGALYKEKRIRFEGDGIRSVDSDAKTG